MSQYLGPLGGLVPVPCASSLAVSREPRYSTVLTVEGVARAQLAPHPLPRTWALSADVEAPGALDVVEGFALGLYGRGPFTWVPDDAAALSVLTPAQSALTRLGPEFSAAGPVVVDGVALPVSASVSVPSSWRGLVDVPVVPGVPVTASVWVQAASGAPIISTGWVVGGGIPGTESVTGSSGGMWQRLSWTGVAPTGASQLRLGVRSSVTAVAGPQVTYTTGPVPYAMGRAASSVIVESAESTPIYLPGPYSSGQWIVREVGDAGW